MDAPSHSGIKKAFEYISQDSSLSANKVINEITALADKLPEQPEMFPPDKYKKNNDGAAGEPLKHFTTEFHTV